MLQRKLRCSYLFKTLKPLLLDNYPLRKFLNYNGDLLLIFYLVFILFPMTLANLEFILPHLVPRIPLSVCPYQYALLLVFLITVIFTKVRYYVIVVLIISLMRIFLCVYSAFKCLPWKMTSSTHF